ncbi:unnamed protein product [Prunus armeniaca]
MATSVTSSGPSIASFLKLDEDNYPEWLRQMKPFLIGQGLYKFVDGSHPKPPAIIRVVAPTTSSPTDAPAATVHSPNPALLTWIQQDQLVVSYITTTLTKPIISLTIGCETAQAIWECLHHHFSQTSIASSASLQFQLLDIMKGTKSLNKYLLQVKHIADSLVAINKLVDPKYFSLFEALVPNISCFELPFFKVLPYPPSLNFALVLLHLKPKTPTLPLPLHPPMLSSITTPTIGPSTPSPTSTILWK